MRDHHRPRVDKGLRHSRFRLCSPRALSSVLSLHLSARSTVRRDPADGPGVPPPPPPVATPARAGRLPGRRGDPGSAVPPETTGASTSPPVSVETIRHLRAGSPRQNEGASSSPSSASRAVCFGRGNGGSTLTPYPCEARLRRSVDVAPAPQQPVGRGAGPSATSPACRSS